MALTFCEDALINISMEVQALLHKLQKSLCRSHWAHYSWLRQCIYLQGSIRPEVMWTKIQRLRCIHFLIVRVPHAVEPGHKCLAKSFDISYLRYYWLIACYSVLLQHRMLGFNKLFGLSARWNLTILLLLWLQREIFAKNEVFWLKLWTNKIIPVL